MLKAVKNNKSNIEEKKKIKISYNEEKCYKCNENNFMAISNDGGSLSYCKNCNIYVILFEYIDEKDYNDLIETNKIGSRLFNNSAFKKENAYYSSR